MSEELREKIDMELATGGDGALVADCDADSDILVVEYVSDDETLATPDKVKPDDSNDDECDHVLKVSGEKINIYYLLYHKEFHNLPVIMNHAGPSRATAGPGKTLLRGPITPSPILYVLRSRR